MFPAFNPFEHSKKQLKCEDHYRTKYGLYRGHYAWDLACQWFKMDNDSFFRTYGFSFVPKDSLFDEAKEFVYNS